MSVFVIKQASIAWPSAWAVMLKKDAEKRLKTNSFKKSVISECTELFHIHKFEELLDTNVNLIGFNNGV